MQDRLLKVVREAVVLFLLAFSLASACPVPSQSPKPAANQQEKPLKVPAGTVLPVRLNGALSVRKTKPGQNISARIMQDVPLPNGRKIAQGSKVVGTVVSVEPAAQGTGGKISFRFDKVITRKGELPVVTSLRALASFLEVQEAQTPEFSPGFGTPYTWANTRQIGGDEVYGVGGPVTNRWNERVGTGVYGGVLVHVRARPESECRGTLGTEDQLQALWVFSADACGVYGIEGVKIARAGRSEPTGEIQLSVAKGDRVVRSSSAMLLRVVR
jgi:hypothetical protein